MSKRRARILAIVAALLAGPSAAFATATINFTGSQTQQAPVYAPANVVAVWVETELAPGQPGQFVKTIYRHSQVRTIHLVNWSAARQGVQEADIVSGATQINYLPISATWDYSTLLGAEAPDGNYQFVLELADQNTGINQLGNGANNLARFSFQKGPVAISNGPLNQNGFNNVTYTAQPNIPGQGPGGPSNQQPETPIENNDSDIPVVIGGCGVGGLGGGAPWAGLFGIYGSWSIWRRRTRRGFRRRKKRVSH